MHSTVSGFLQIFEQKLRMRTLAAALTAFERYEYTSFYPSTPLRIKTLSLPKGL